MLRILRERAGLSREQLVARLGSRISISMLLRWENDSKEPSMTRRDWTNFCDAVGIPFDELPMDLAVVDSRLVLLRQLPALAQQSGSPAEDLAPQEMSVQESPSVTLAELRRRVGLTQQRLAEVLNGRFEAIGSERRVAQKALCDWEMGRFRPRLTPAEFIQMAESLQCSLPALEASIRCIPCCRKRLKGIDSGD